jgi:hypothetical protein
MRRLLVAMLLVPGIAAAQNTRSNAILTTTHFAFYSDLATNVNDALIASAVARRAREPELFIAGPEKACFDGLAAADRDGWTRAVAYYTEGKSTGFQRVLLRLQLAGLAQRSGMDDPANRQYLEEVAAMRNAATPAYQRCRWQEQDVLNRRWIDRVKPLLETHEAALGQVLPRLFQTPWAGLPFRVDLVQTVSPGANSASPDYPTLHILVSSTNSGNQDRAALETVFHEAVHFLATNDSPLGIALASAIKEGGGAPQPGLVHQVHFFLIGEAVRRVFVRAGGEPYTPYLYEHRLFSDQVRAAAQRIWPAYVDGTRTLPQAAGDFVRALNTGAPKAQN